MSRPPPPPKKPTKKQNGEHSGKTWVKFGQKFWRLLKCKFKILETYVRNDINRLGGIKISMPLLTIEKLKIIFLLNSNILLLSVTNKVYYKLKSV